VVEGTAHLTTESYVGELFERIAALEAVQAVLDTLYRYGHTIDYGLRDDWLDCFDAGGVFEILHRGQRKARYEGREQLTRFIAAHTAAPDAYHKHLLVEPRVHLGPDTEDDSYFVRVDDDADGAPVVHGFGRYRDRLVHCSDGRWRFAERVAEIDAFDGRSRPGAWART
jgi:hypothetical protein